MVYLADWEISHTLTLVCNEQEFKEHKYFIGSVIAQSLEEKFKIDECDVQIVQKQNIKKNKLTFGMYKLNFWNVFFFRVDVSFPDGKPTNVNRQEINQTICDSLIDKFSYIELSSKFLET